MINIQVVYALPEMPTIIDCYVDDNCSVGEAITQSNILSQHNIELANHKIGIYGKAVELSSSLKADDRIEIYRPLINDPKEIRRKRSLAQKMKKDNQ